MSTGKKCDGLLGAHPEPVPFLQGDRLNCASRLPQALSYSEKEGEKTSALRGLKSPGNEYISSVEPFARDDVQRRASQ